MGAKPTARVCVRTVAHYELKRTSHCADIDAVLTQICDHMFASGGMNLHTCARPNKRQDIAEGSPQQ
eukprot:15450471-Alexandrium_andersonii.AAC.1